MPRCSLLINADAPAGKRQVRVSDELWKPVPGFNDDDALPFTGDSVAHEISPTTLQFGLLFVALLIEVALIFGLRRLEHLPYRPPHDMSTLLGGPELELFRFAITALCVICFLTLIGLVVTLWRYCKK